MKNEAEDNFKEASDYSPEELKQFREIFVTDLKQNQAIERQYANSILFVFLAGFVTVVCSYLLSQPPTKWLFGAGIFLVAAGIISIAIAAFSLQKTKMSCLSQFIYW